MAYSKAEEIYKIVESNSSNLLLRVKILFITIIALIFITGLSVYFVFTSLSQLEQTEKLRFQSLSLSNQVRQSSDQLTLMARAYASTGNEKYLRFFNQILAIRNGKAPRPANYDRVYWDFLMPQDAIESNLVTKPISLQVMLHQVGISEVELDNLSAAQAASDNLVNIEQEAFVIVAEGLQQTVPYRDTSHRLKALDLLYSEEYLQAKANIMSKVNHFMQLIEQRTSLATQKSKALNRSAVVTSSVCFVLLIFSVSLYAYFRDKYNHRLINQLYDLVDEQFQSLKDKNKTLEENAKAMKESFEHLVQSEKMACLGGLVAGVAHEVNTPLGIAVTASDFIATETENLDKQLQEETLSRSTLQNFLESSKESTRLLSKSLKRASELIRAFKQVSVDQSVSDVRKIELRAYVEDILMSVGHLFKGKDIVINNRIPQYLALNTDVGSVVQVFTHLINNSFVHGFDNGRLLGEIDLSAKQVGECIIITYQDNGQGMDANVKNKIFDPFFTTNRGNGCSGLGMSIVYNIITSKLGGSIECKSDFDEGTEFVITLDQVNAQ
ncbi:sensor histidine kinase [Thalassotalea marina]|uniref:histidine kinase n=1 Tax=Thalassotalea marina TaxID=1673741 RepID=A0A919BPL5_9GAMM|nr:HAMP domain-containing sensor histidine kinase [Thalassotalea marina]GHG05919.1 hypothetical protein GCM10017161_39360 [Thalassotalea marina]